MEPTLRPPVTPPLPPAASADLILARTHLSQGRVAEARTLIESCLAVAPNDPEAVRLMHLIDSGEYKRANRQSIWQSRGVPLIVLGLVAWFWGVLIFRSSFEVHPSGRPTRYSREERIGPFTYRAGWGRAGLQFAFGAALCGVGIVVWGKERRGEKID